MAANYKYLGLNQDLSPIPDENDNQENQGFLSNTQLDSLLEDRGIGGGKVSHISADKITSGTISVSQSLYVTDGVTRRGVFGYIGEE